MRPFGFGHEFTATTSSNRARTGTDLPADRIATEARGPSGPGHDDLGLVSDRHGVGGDGQGFRGRDDQLDDVIRMGHQRHYVVAVGLEAR